jgi:hypothetical protein
VDAEALPARDTPRRTWYLVLKDGISGGGGLSGPVDVRHKAGGVIMFSVGRWTAFCLAAVCISTLHCTDGQQQNQEGGTEFMYGADGKIIIIAREGTAATVGFNEVFGCHHNCTSACSRAEGDAYVIDAADFGITPNSPDPNFSPRIDFEMGATKGTFGMAISHCMLWTQQFVVEPRQGSSARDLTGDFHIDCVIHFDTGDANNYIISVELGLDSFGPQEEVEQTYCRQVLVTQHGNIEGCNDPPQPVEDLTLQIADFTFEPHVVYRAWVQMLANISSSDADFDLGGDIEGHLAVHGLRICIDCE